MSELFIPVTIGATFVAVAAGAYAFASSVVSRRRTVRLLGAHPGGGTPNLREEDLARPFGQRVAWPFVARLGRVVRRVSPLSVRPRLARKLELAGNPSGVDAERMAAFKIVGVVLGGVGGFALAGVIGTRGPMTAGAVALFGAIGFVLPNAVLAQRGLRRQEAIRRALPDTIDLLTISVEAGLGFDAALAEVIRNFPGPLSEEIGRMLQEVNLGVSRVEALRHMSERTEVAELGAFVLALVQAEMFGVSVARVLRAQAKELRQKRRQRAEAMAQKVPVKLLFPMIFCVLPALFVVILGPGVIRMMQTFFGISP
jgi:tight adherence protein C